MYICIYIYIYIHIYIYIYISYILRRYTKIARLPDQTPLHAHLGLRTEPCCVTPGDPST